MRWMVFVLLWSTVVQAELESLRPHVEAFHGKGKLEWLSQLRVPRLPADAVSVYGNEQPSNTGRYFATWVIGVQSGKSKDAAAAWGRLTTAPEWRRRLATHFRRCWSGKYSTACLDAIVLVGNDEFNRRFAERRRKYLAACTKQIPNPLDATVAAEQKVRLWVEGLRRMGPLWSCRAGAPPSFHGEPNAWRVLRASGPAAYPDLVIASGDLRPAGRHMSLGGMRGRTTVSYIARELFRQELELVEDEDTLEAWIQSGSWNDSKATAAWFLHHSQSAHFLVHLVLRSGSAPKRLTDHTSPLVRVAVAAVGGKLEALRGERPGQLPMKRFPRDDDATRAAVRAWTLAAARLGKEGRELLAATLKRAAPTTRDSMLWSLCLAKEDRKLARVCFPWLEPSRTFWARAAAGAAVRHHSGTAFADGSADEVADRALAWSKKQR